MRRYGAVIAVIAALGVCTEVAAQELRGRVRETFQHISDEDGGFNSVLQNYEISFKSNVTRTLYWQARMRALLTGLDDPSMAASSDTILREPFFQIVFQGSEWDASGGARLTTISPKGDRSTVPGSERKDLFGRVGWTREDLPQVDWAVYRVDIEADGIETSREDRSLLTGSYGRGPGNLNLSVENRWFTDPRSDFTRDSIQVTGNGDLRGSFFDDRLILSGQALALEGRVDEETPRAITVDVLRRARNGLFVDDPTPLVGFLADTPSLIDGNLNAPAADLSGDFRNFGVDLGFDENVDTAFLYIERQLLPGSEQDYSWDVFTSADGEFWNVLVVSANARFEPLQNRFEIRFPAVLTRFVKIVNTNFSRNEPPLAATELELLGEEIRSGKERSTQSFQNGNVTAFWRASRIVDVTFNTFANRQRTDSRVGLRTDEDLNASLTTTVRPGRTTTTVRLQAINRSSTRARPEADRIASVSFGVSPLPDLDLSVTGTHRRNASRGSVLVEADSITMRGAARFSSALEMAVDLGLLHQDDAPIDRETTRRSALVSLITTLRPGLLMTNSWSAERILFRGGGASGLPDRTDLDLRSRLSYRPTRVLGVAVEALYQDIAGVSGFSRLYDLDWLPFSGGALQIQMSYREDRRSFAGDLREEARVGARWTVNPRTLIDMAYTVIRSGAAGAERQEITSVFLEHRF